MRTRPARLRPKRRHPVVPRAVLLLVLAAVLAFPAGAHAWKIRGHFYAAGKATEEIMAGHNRVTIGGQQFPVRPEVAKAIRDFPELYRGGVAGPDVMPDLAGGQGAIHPDTRTDNDRAPDSGPGQGKSFTHEWLRKVYDAAWRKHRRCGGCVDGRRALAYAYGFLTHPAGDVWAHTFVNEYADGVFPGVGELEHGPDKREHAVRHLVVEGYVDRHTPQTGLEMSAPLDFVEETLVDSPSEGRHDGERDADDLGRGMLMEAFKKIERDLGGDIRAHRHRARVIEKDLTTQDTFPVCAFGGCIHVPDPTDAPINVIEATAIVAERVTILAKQAYAEAWLEDVETGIDAYVALNLDLGRKLFANADEDGEPHADVKGASDAAQRFVTAHLLSMYGVPDAVGGVITGIGDFSRWVESVVGDVPPLPQLRQAKDALVDWILEATFGMSPTELKSYLEKPEQNINRGEHPVRLPADTSRKVDQAMGLDVDGVQDAQVDFDPSEFAPMRNTIELSKMALLDRAGLNQLVGNGGGFPEDNVMLGWVRSADGDYQWQTRSRRDGKRYGEGEFFLWRDCQARTSVFLRIFQKLGLVRPPGPHVGRRVPPRRPDEQAAHRELHGVEQLARHRRFGDLHLVLERR